MAEISDRPETAIARPSENRLNLLHLVAEKSEPSKDTSSQTPTTDELRSLLRSAERIRLFSAADGQELVGSEIDQLDKGDLKTIADITATLKKEPFDPKAMDKILEPYECFPERLRNLMNPLDLWLQKQGIDRFQDKPGHPEFAVDGGYTNYPDLSEYNFSIRHNRKAPFYKYTLSGSCS